MKNFSKTDLKKLHTGGGQITIIGGSDLFHGAPILSLKAASRIVDMVFFASPEPSFGNVAEKIKSQLSSFVWIPWSDVGEYVEKSDAVLIGPGMKRWGSEKKSLKAQKSKVFDTAGRETQKIVKRLLKKYPKTRWVIDGGALQVMDPRWIPQNSILTPNNKEQKLLFGKSSAAQTAKKYKCIVVNKSPVSIVCSPTNCVQVHGGNPGLSKGGTGDVLAGITVALSATNDPLLAASAASWIVKNAADELSKRVGTAYNADDLAEKAPEILGKYL